MSQSTYEIGMDTFSAHCATC